MFEQKVEKNQMLNFFCSVILRGFFALYCITRLTKLFFRLNLEDLKNYSIAIISIKTNPFFKIK
jgi:hypothetical protein